MNSANIEIADNRDHFTVGDTIRGIARVNLAQDLSPTTNVTVSFHCIGEVKWVEHNPTQILSPKEGMIYNEEVKYHQEILPIANDIQVNCETNDQKVTIPFSFHIPKDNDLPSSMVTKQGFIKYFIRVTIRDNEEKFKYFTKDIQVQAPMSKNLMISVGGSAERIVSIHHGTVTMHATIGRKGFAPGESITVHIAVDNSTNTPVVPQVVLQQVQIYMSGIRHKTIENTITEEPVTGEPIASKTTKEMANWPTQLEVLIPKDLVLSIKSSVITVKYFVRVTLKIPHSLDLHVNLPVVITSDQVISQLPKPTIA